MLTPPSESELAADQTAIDRIIGSQTFHNSESLCRVLRFLDRRAREDPTATIKEFEIAREALGRGPDFDPRIDSVVRVTIARLRAKLDEYYADENRDEPVRFRIPKGHYALQSEKPADRPSSNQGRLPPRNPSRLRHWWIFPALIFPVLAGLWAAYTFKPVTAPPEPVPRASALGMFWQSFLQSPERPLIVYSNARFVGKASTGLRYYDPVRDHSSSVLDHYTGVGEVMAVYSLTTLFSEFQRRVEVKRALLLNWDDARKTNVIFVGSASENPPLRELPRGGDLMLTPGGLVNTRTSATQQRVLRNSAAVEYALIRMNEGFVPGSRMLTLAGVTTLGTQAAAEFVCREDKLVELFAALGYQAIGTVRIDPFEAAIEVGISGGVPIETKLAVAQRLAPVTGTGRDAPASAEMPERH